jgi:hypothetical protein
VLFRTLIPDPRYFQDSKTWRMRHFESLGLRLKPVWSAGHHKTVRGLKVNWQIEKRLRSVK